MSLAVPYDDAHQSLLDEYLRILKTGGALEIWELLPHRPSQDKRTGRAANTRTYLVSSDTPVGACQSPYLRDYKRWIHSALRQLQLSAAPCSRIRRSLLEKADSLGDCGYQRVAIPLSELDWEEGDIRFKLPRNGEREQFPGHRTLTREQAALRQTALLNVVETIESLEPVLRAASGMNNVEWSRWSDDMKQELLRNNGTAGGDCLEIGAWWACKL